MPTSAMPWIKVHCDILNDRKLLPLSRSTRFTYIELEVLAGECDADGALIDSSGALDSRFIAWRFDMPVKELERDLDALRGAGLIDDVDGALTVLRFRERQGRRHSERLEQYKLSQQKRRAAVSVDTTLTAGERQQPVNVDTTLTQQSVNVDTTARQQPVNSPEGEREEEKEKEGEESKTSAQAPHAPRQPNPLFDAVAEVTATNPKLMGPRIGKCAAQLAKVGATPDQVKQVAKWYERNDWRGKKGEKLTFALLIEVWEMGLRNVAAHPAGAQHANPNEPAGFAAIREAMLDPKYQER